MTSVSTADTAASAPGRQVRSLTDDGAGPAATMRVSALHAPGQVVVEERPVPTPGPGQVLVHIVAVGICGSDVHYFRHGRIAHYVVREPLVLGHEAGGRIVAVGPGVDAARVGERVALEPGVPCRVCRECKAGRYNLCPDVEFFATPPFDGTFAEYVCLAADFAHPVPDALSDDAAALIEPLSVAVWACGKGGVAAGSRVLISGAGPIGIMTAQVARALGATSITVSDIAPVRLAAAARFGATRTIDARSSSASASGIEVDTFLDCSGSPAAIAQGITAVAPGGRVVLVGMGADEVTLPLGLIQGRELTITGTFRYANTYPTAIALAAAGRIDLDGMVTGHFSLDEAETALRQDTDPAAMKVIVRPGPAVPDQSRHRRVARLPTDPGGR
jgi:L-iditol 2-dehydrogenase